MMIPKMIKRVRWLSIILLLGSLFLVGCSNNQGEQLDAGETYWLTPGQGLGQTFTGEWDELSGVQIFFAEIPQSNGTLNFKLTSSPTNPDPLVEGEVPLGDVNTGWLSLSFEPLHNSQNRDLFLTVSIKPTPASDNLRIGLAAGRADSYLDGALYSIPEGVSPEPLEAQLAFRLIYTWRGLFGGILIELLKIMMCLAAGIWLLVLPGAGMLSLVGLHRKLDLLEFLALGAGSGIALYPLLMAWGNLQDLLSPAISRQLLLILPSLLGLITLIWHLYRDKWTPKIKLSWISIMLFVLVALVFVVRLCVIRRLVFPLGGDSYSHTVMAQLIMENGGIFESWMPYAPYEGLSIQFGFSAAAALFGWLLDLRSWQAVLITGQLVNGLAVLVVYPLVKQVAVRFVDEELAVLAGSAAIFVAGLLMTQPAYYVNWGRYAQLGGQVILPVALWMLWELVRTQDRNLFRVALLMGVVTSGMALYYYRLAFFLVAIGFPLILWVISEKRIENKQDWLVLFGRLSLAVLITLVMFSPWIYQVSGSRLSGVMISGVVNPRTMQGITADYITWTNLYLFIPAWQIQIGAVAGLWGLFRKWLRSSTLAILSGVVLLISFRLGMIIHLPGANMMDQFSIIIFLYFPIAILVGQALGDIGGLLRRVSRVLNLVLIAGLMAAACWFGYIQMRIVNPFDRALATRADLRAFQWIKSNLSPSDGIFLTEAFSYYWNSINGSDGGLWLPLLTKGFTATTPVQYAHLNEKPLEADFNQRIVSMVAWLEENDLNSSESITALCGLDVQYVYLGQRRGVVGNVPPLFTAEELQQTNLFRLIYAQDRVQIYQRIPGFPCPK